MTPGSGDAPETHRQYILESYLRGFNATGDKLENAGENLTIGIADSAAYVEPDNDITIEDGTDYYPTRSRDPLGHGTTIFELLSYYLPEAEYRFYRIIGGYKRKHRRSDNLVRAIAKARADGVDLLNISSGIVGATDDPAAISNQEITNLTSRALTIVAATGNYIEQNVEKPTSPANNQNAIGVSGYEPRCDIDDTDRPTELNKGRYSVMNPDINDLVGGDPIYCGYENHESGECMTCDQCHIDETVWPRNVDPDPEKGKPDVLAPVTYPTISDGNMRKKVGTSFAAPIVTAALGRCLNSVANQRVPTSVELRKKIIRTGMNIGAEQGVKMDVEALEAALKPSSGPSPLSVD